MNKATRESLLPRVSVNRPVLVTMVLLALMVLGAVAYSRIPIKLMPSGLDPNFLYVRIRYSNSSPQESEQQITRPLEESIRAIKGIEQIRTWSSDSGTRAYIRFRADTDMSLAYNQLVDRLDRLKPSFPEEARDGARVYKWSMDSWDILWVGLGLDLTIADPFDYVNQKIVRPLERIDGVGAVDLYGVHEKEVMVEIDRDRLGARGVSLGQVVQALQGDNFALAGGAVTQGEKKYYVRSLARYTSIGQIENIRIGTRRDDVDIRLKDIASVLYDYPVGRRGRQLVDGEPAVAMGIKQESGANVVATCERVERMLDQIEQENPGLKFNIFFNQGAFIKDSIRNLQGTGLWGGLFAAFVLLYFLRTVRMTSIITLAIPLCLMITLTATYFIGWSMNVITMMGLMVGVGMVVDNAIVILENIYRFRAADVPPRPAAVRGASEVALAITMATLTTVVVFVPMMLMGGSNHAMNFYLTRMGVPVVIALIASLFVALIFIPLASVRFGGSGGKTDPRLIAWARGFYLKALRWTITHRRDAALLAVVIFATVVYPSANMKRSDGGGRALNDFRIRMRMPSHFTIDATRDLVLQVDEFLAENREKYDIRTVRTYYRETYAYIQVFLESRANEPWYYVTYKNARIALGVPAGTEMERSEVVKDVRERMPRFVGVDTNIEGRSDSGNDPNVRVVLEGDDTAVLETMVAEVRRRLLTIPSVLSAQLDVDDDDALREEVRVRVDRQRALKYGISTQVVARTIAFALQGVTLPRFQSDDREVRVRLYIERSDRRTLQQLKSLTFTARSGEEIPLAEIADMRVQKSSGEISRQDGKTRIQIRAYTTKQDLKQLYSEVDMAMAGFGMPRGYTWNKGERFRNLRETDETTNFAVIMAVTSVFLLMGVLFESFILPFSVLLSIPFAVLGVYWTLFLTGTPFDMMAGVGMIILVGVVVNNAIVLVDMINRLRTDGMSRIDAIIEAGSNRFRPILMTTFTTIFGLLPMALGNSNLMGTPYAPLGRTMMGGLLSSTFLTLLMVPLLYTLLDDLRGLLVRVAGSAFTGIGTRGVPAAEAAPAGDDD